MNASSPFVSLFTFLLPVVYVSLVVDCTDMIIENAVLVNKFISTPKDLSGLNCAAFVAGVVEGILDGADFVRTLTSAAVLLFFFFPLLSPE